MGYGVGIFISERLVIFTHGKMEDHVYVSGERSFVFDQRKLAVSTFSQNLLGS